MITMKTDHGWINIKSWKDLEEMPGYTRDIDPKQVKMKDVVGKYLEPELRVCGLSSCHRNHFKGYLVTLLMGGVINIGVDCGKTHFGVEFEKMSKQLDSDYRSQERREIVKTAINKLENWQSTCDELLRGDHGASWLYKQNNMREKQLPQSILDRLSEMIKAESNILYKDRITTKREREIAIETGQSNVDTVREEVGMLNGVSSLGMIGELRSLLAMDLEPNLKALADVDVDSATDKDLAYWSKWIDDVDFKLSKASAIIKQMKVFFTRDNISKLTEITESREEQKAVMNLAKQYK